jgi:Ca2+-binding EF-hand superfamily protein
MSTAKTLLLAAAVVTLAPTALLAANPNSAGDAAAPTPETRADRPRGGGEWFKRLDANQDGVITKDEAASAQRIAKNFDELDADHDGMITQDEMRAAAEARREEMKEAVAARFKAADTNADGLLSKDEATAGMPRLANHFDRLDANRDGQLTPEELANARHHHAGGKRRSEG